MSFWNLPELITGGWAIIGKEATRINGAFVSSFTLTLLGESQSFLLKNSCLDGVKLFECLI